MRFYPYILSYSLVVIGIDSSAQGYINQSEFQHYSCPEHKTGCYLSYKDFNEDHPVITKGFELERKKKNEKTESKSGGYILNFTDKEPKPDSGSIRQKIKIDLIWGIYYNDTLYINRKLYIGKKGFDKVFCLGNQGYFHGINPTSESNYANDYLNWALPLAITTGLIVNDYALEANDDKFGSYPRLMIYILDYETGMISPLTSFKLEKILEDDPKLYDSYLKEEHKFSMRIMHLYIDAYAERHKNEIINK